VLKKTHTAKRTAGGGRLTAGGAFLTGLAVAPAAVAAGETVAAAAAIDAAGEGRPGPGRPASYKSKHYMMSKAFYRTMRKQFVKEKPVAVAATAGDDEDVGGGRPGLEPDLAIPADEAFADVILAAETLAPLKLCAPGAVRRPGEQQHQEKIINKDNQSNSSLSGGRAAP
jgi:hypothetical protein